MMRIMRLDFRCDSSTYPADCMFSDYTPNKDMASLHVVHKEVDKTRDPRLDV